MDQQQQTIPTKRKYRKHISVDKANKIKEMLISKPHMSLSKIADRFRCPAHTVYNIKTRMKKEGNEPLTTTQNQANVKDMVNSPKHYTVGGIETIDFIQAKLTPEQFIGYLLGNVIKYSSRHGHKDDVVKDAGKLKWYAARLEDVLKG